MGALFVDILVFFGFIACVLFVGFYKSRTPKGVEEGAEDYFLAGRGLKWWLIGFSLIAANISAEQFVGMSGQGAGLEGLSCASWEWTASVVLVVVAYCMLPYFLKTGITTMPEFLEKRYNHIARSIMTVSMIGILIMASLIGVVYAGSLVMWQTFSTFGLEVTFSTCCVMLSVIAGAYVLFGGLKACAWADLLQGAALILGGILIAWIACDALCDASEATSFVTGELIPLPAEQGFTDRLMTLNESKMHMGPQNTTAMTWTVLIMGIWIPHFYYWGLNQYITQRLLGSGSLAEGQKGIVLAAGLKLLIPFIIIIPGIIAFNLFATPMASLQAQKVKQSIELTQHPERSIRGATAYQPNDLILFKSGVEKGEWDVWVTQDDGSKVKVKQHLSPEDLAWITAHNAPLLARLTAAYPETALVNASGMDVAAIEALAKASGKKDAIEIPSEAPIILVTNNYKYDGALGLLMGTVKEKCSPGVLGFILAALLGAIVSSLAAVLNATSTLFTMDIYRRYLCPKASQRSLIFVGRTVTVALVVVGCIAAATLNSDSIFAYIQEVQCYISPGVVAVFAFGMLNRSAGQWAGVLGLLIAPVLYFFLSTYGWNCFPGFIITLFQKFGCATGEMHYLIAASYTLVLTLLILILYGCLWKLPKKVEFNAETSINLTGSKVALFFGIAICLATAALYILFW